MKVADWLGFVWSFAFVRVSWSDDSLASIFLSCRQHLPFAISLTMPQGWRCLAEQAEWSSLFNNVIERLKSAVIPPFPSSALQHCEVAALEKSKYSWSGLITTSCFQCLFQGQVLPTCKSFGFFLGIGTEINGLRHAVTLRFVRFIISKVLLEGNC